MVLDGTPIRPADVRFSGSAAGGQAKAIVDGAGRLVDLTVDALLLRRPPRGIADAILSAVQQAQDEAAAAAAPPMGGAGITTAPAGIGGGGVASPGAAPVGHFRPVDSATS